MNLHELRRIVDTLPSRTVSCAKRGVGSFVTIDVGAKHSRRARDGTSENVADLHVWIHLCDWELVKRGDVLLSSDAPEDAFSSALACVVGATLERIDVGTSRHEVVIVLDEGLQFLLRENLEEYDVEDDLLLLYPYDGEAIGYRSDLGFYKDSEL